MNLENEKFPFKLPSKIVSFPFGACCSVELILVLYDIDWLKAYCDFLSILGFIMEFQTQSKGFKLNLFLPFFQRII